ncbi:hypothetical protein BH24ACT21_BH24ACT21_16940 [soil metagenome]|jgi:hypothetical protein
MKRLMILIAMLAATLALQVSPAFAQDSASLDQYSEDTGGNSVTLDFELAVQGTPPVDKSFFGFIPAEGGIATQLTDPDGDGVYTGSMDVPQYAPGPRPVPEGVDPVTLPVQIVMSSEVKYGVPLYPEVIEDFGQVLMDEDKTFSTTIVFDGPAKPFEPETPKPEPGNPQPTTPESTTPDPNGNGGSTDSLGIVDVLPDTGGASVPILGMIALLAGGGFLFVSLRLMGFLRRH